MHKMYPELHKSSSAYIPAQRLCNGMTALMCMSITHQPMRMSTSQVEDIGASERIWTVERKVCIAEFSSALTMNVTCVLCAFCKCTKKLLDFACVHAIL